MKNASHILFEHGHKELTTLIFLVSLPPSNGDLDRWSGGGDTEGLSDTLVAVNISRGGPSFRSVIQHPIDPQSLQIVHLVEIRHMKQWVSNFCGNYRRQP